MGIRVRKMVAVGHLVHKYDEILCSIHQGGHPASHKPKPCSDRSLHENWVAQLLGDGRLFFWIA